jgi:hypothetical protein
MEAHEGFADGRRDVRLAIASTLLLATPAVATSVGPPVPTASKTTPAQQMIALYRDQYAHWQFKPCPPARPGEVVVCGNGRRGSANRIPLPDERAPPDRARTATGDLPSAREALALTDQPCGAAVNCQDHAAADLVAATIGMVQVVRAVVDPEGASDYADRHPWKPQE